MRTFIIRARKGSTRWDKIRSQVGSHEHFEIIAHCLINAFFISSDFRTDVEVYVILDSSEDFPRTIRFMGNEGLSFNGFHESAMIDLLEIALKNSQGIQKDEVKRVAPGVEVAGFGFDKLVAKLMADRTVFLLEPKGEDIREQSWQGDEVFILSDHLAMPKNIYKSLKRKGLKSVSLGNTMLFASQCMVLIQDQLDRNDNAN